MNIQYRPITLVLCLALSFLAQASNLEFPALQNIKQITTPSMGFEKAGESYFSPDGKTVIFQAVPTGEKNYQIYSINLAEGSLPQLVSTGLGACTCAFFRPDGEKIIFASSHEAPNTIDEASQKPGYQRDTKNYVWEFTSYMNIYQANPDGSALQALTQGPAYSAECAYSADGSHIVLASNRSGDMNLYTMCADGSNLQQHTFTTNVYNGGPFFSPDGTKILYRADPEMRHYLQIYCLDLQTGENRQITANDAINWAPFWHPDGDVIVFTTSLHGHSQYELYLLNIKTDVLYRLTNNPGFDGLGSFNKDGTQITWTSKRGPDQTCQIFVADFILPEELVS
jgi:TolB protein